jgi:hypothetical protein
VREIVGRLGGHDHLLGTAAAPGLPVVEPPCRFVTTEGNVVGAYLACLPAAALATTLAARAEPKKSTRFAGLPTHSAVFGALPRLTFRNDYCRFTAATTQDPVAWAGAQAVCRMLAGLYAEHLPEAFAAHMASSANVRPEWLIDGTPWATLNFNYNFAIPYHRDSGNERAVFSNVLIARRGVVGGRLNLPEFGVALAQRDGHVVIFDGQAVVHGVTPLRRVVAGGYRISLVAYTMQQMRACLAPGDEMARARQVRTDRREAHWRSSAPQPNSWRKQGRNGAGDLDPSGGGS